MSYINNQIKNMIFSDRFLKLTLAKDKLCCHEAPENEIMEKCNVNLKSIMIILDDLINNIAVEILTDSEMEEYELAVDNMNDKLFRTSFDVENVESMNEYYW